MSISKIASYLKTNKRTIFCILTFLSVSYLSVQGVSAEPWDGLTAEQSQKVVGILNGIITLMASVMWMVTSFITIFLYPGWVNGTLFGLQDYLKEIWILVSNIIYFIFAFIIIVIAFMNIIGKWEWNWELKQAMPKFIIGILIVPFSWFFVQFVLAISAVLTVWVLTLPYDSFKDQALLSTALDGTELAGSKICKDVVISLSWEFEWNTSSLGWDDSALSENIRCKDGWEITIKQLFEWTDGWEGLDNTIFGVISVYTYWVLKIQELDTISWRDLTSIKGIADLVLKIFFDIFFIVVYLLLMIALFLALFVRGVRLWIYAMLSPAFGLLYFFWKTGDGFGKSWEKFNVKEFIALALVPVYVAAALSFGLIFILTASEWLKTTVSSTDEDVIEAWGFSLSIIWAHGDGVEEKSVIGKLIVEMFWVVILWIAVMAALWASKTTEAIVQPIAKFGEDVWALAAKAPTYAPIIPTWSWWMSVASLPTVSSTIKSWFDSEATRKGTSFASGILWDTDSALQGLNNSVRETQARFDQFSDSANVNSADLMWVVRENLEEATSFNDIRVSDSFRARLQQTGAALDITWHDDWDLSNQDQLMTALREIHNATLPQWWLFEWQTHLWSLSRTVIDGFLADDSATPAWNWGTTPPTEPSVANNFNLNTTLVGDGTITRDRVNWIEAAVREANLTTWNRQSIRTAILNMIPETDADREAKADALVDELELT